MRLIKIKRRIGPNARQNSYLLPSFITSYIENRPSLKKISANIGWLFFDNIFRMFVALFVGVLVARYLGPERFGILSYAIAFVSLFSALAKLGLDGIVVRDIVKEPDKADEILGTAFVLKLFGGILLILFSVGFISLLRPSDHLSRWLVTIIAVGLFFQAFDVIIDHRAAQIGAFGNFVLAGARLVANGHEHRKTSGTRGGGHVV